MEKLIELLNEYDPKNGWEITDEGIDNIWKIYDFHSQLQIISKKFGFINWLLDKEKIDLLRLTCTAIGYTEIIDADFSREDRLIMILAIQVDPISFLISYLK